jgi:hypothetical protein
MTKAFTRKRVSPGRKAFKGPNRSSRRTRARRPINDDTSIKKFMRYARQGKLPPERLRVIKLAQENAMKRADVYRNSNQQPAA